MSKSTRKSITAFKQTLPEEISRVCYHLVQELLGNSNGISKNMGCAGVFCGECPFYIYSLDKVTDHE